MSFIYFNQPFGYGIAAWPLFEIKNWELRSREKSTAFEFYGERIRPGRATPQTMDSV